MAKIDLNLLAYGAGEILTREELKNISMESLKSFLSENIK